MINPQPLENNQYVNSFIVLKHGFPGLSVKETKEELFNLRFQQATGNLEKPSRIRDLRHTVARLKTVLKERETVEKEG